MNECLDSGQFRNERLLVDYWKSQKGGVKRLARLLGLSEHTVAKWFKTAGRPRLLVGIVASNPVIADRLIADVRNRQTQLAEIERFLTERRLRDRVQVARDLDYLERRKKDVTNETGLAGVRGGPS